MKNLIILSSFFAVSLGLFTLKHNLKSDPVLIPSSPIVSAQVSYLRPEISTSTTFEAGQAPADTKECERPSKDNPDVGAHDKNRVGCTCQRKCANGQPIENYEAGKSCKSHCHPDKCHCPDPCKT